MSMMSSGSKRRYHKDSSRYIT